MKLEIQISIWKRATSSTNKITKAHAFNTCNAQTIDKCTSVCTKNNNIERVKKYRKINYDTERNENGIFRCLKMLAAHSTRSVATTMANWAWA